MPVTALVSILSPDRIGLVATVTGYLFDLGANLGDTSFAVLGGGSEFTSVCELPPGSDLAAIEVGLKALPELAGAEKVAVTAFELPRLHGETGRITHTIVVHGADRPGLIARLCEVFQQFGANIVRLNAQKIPGGGEYVLNIAVWLPSERADTCLAAVSNTAGSLRLACEWNEV